MNTPDYWLNVLLECNRRDFTPTSTGPAPKEQPGPMFSSRAFAIALRAMARAQLLDGASATPFVDAPISAVPANADAASALSGAAMAVLTRLFPSQTAQIAAAANANPPTHGPSTAWGSALGNAHFAARASDGSAVHPTYTYQQTTGAYQQDPEDRPTPPAIPAGPHWGSVKLFGIQSLLPLNEPPGYVSQGVVNVNDPAYLADHTRVRKEGHESNATNTADQAGIDRALKGIFWAYDGVANLGTPPRLYFQVILSALKAFTLSDERRAMLYGVCATALGDAGIHAWHYKYLYNIWRPITGIREHDASVGSEGDTTPGNSKTKIKGDPFWRPLGAPMTNGSGKNFTPHFPSYPSGHATFGGASLHAFRKVLSVWFPTDVKLGKRKDSLSFDLVSDELNGLNRDVNNNIPPRHQRHFDSIEAAIVENGMSRVYLGVHWVFDAELPKPNKVIGGVPLGINIGEELCTTYGNAIKGVK